MKAGSSSRIVMRTVSTCRHSVSPLRAITTALLSWWVLPDSARM
jgi:hypothetical protein